jgi:hypothetical protein
MDEPDLLLNTVGLRRFRENDLGNSSAQNRRGSHSVTSGRPAWRACSKTYQT